MKKVMKNKIKFKTKPLYSPIREERVKFVAKKFKNYLKESILDVGCDKGYLRQLIPDGMKYIGIDMGGKPDFEVNLEKNKLDRFEDNSFHTVVCTDVLEHLDNLHDVFDDIFRVSRKYIILSLPNA